MIIKWTLEKGIFNIKNTFYDHANNSYMSIFEEQSKENIENQPKPTNIAGESYQIRGGAKRSAVFAGKARE